MSKHHQPSKPSLPSPASLLKQAEEPTYTLDERDLAAPLREGDEHFLGSFDESDPLDDPLDEPVTIRLVLAAFRTISERSRGGHWRISMGDVAEIIKTTLETHVAKEREARGLTEA